jgi:hypothetical protein
MVAVVIGILGHLAAGVWYAASGLVAPWWAVIGLLVVWAGLCVVLWRLARRRSAWALGVPLLDAAIWFAVISIGDALLGWTA